MASFFVQFVRICFSLCKGFNVSTIEYKLIPKGSEDTEYHLMNVAFKQYVHKVLENEEITEMLIDLVKNENLTDDEMKFLENYPILWNACMIKMMQPFWARVNEILTPLRASVRGHNEDVLRASIEFVDFNPFDWVHDSLPGIDSRQIRVDRNTREIELDNRSEREEAIVGRRQQKPSKKLKKRAPVTFPKSSSKSYYNYSKPKKYNKSGRF
ncbi:unnamed protein product [Caenorhabditis brenneri]